MCGLLRFLLERVQHMNGVGQSCNVDHTISSNAVADSNLAYAGTDRWHWLPVVRIKTLLDLVQRVAGLATRILWEVAQSIQTGLNATTRILYHFGYNFQVKADAH